MSKVYFSNLKVVSEDGRYTYTARTLKNLFGGYAFPQDFRFRLKRGWRTLWTQAQVSGEETPRELYVSNQGYTVTRCHGLRVQLLIVRDPTGKESGRVEISEGKDGCTPTRFSDCRILGSTAGLLVPNTPQSLGYFFAAGSNYFAMRFPWNRRLYLELKTGQLVTGEVSSELAEAAQSAETRQAHRYQRCL